jgi:hypothetical protein
MQVSLEEAQKSLAQVEDTVERTKRLLAYGGADMLFIVWGVIWTLGFALTHFVPINANVLRPGSETSASVAFIVISSAWLVLVAAGIVISMIVGRRRMPVRSAVGGRTGIFWWLLYAYVNLWIFLLWPFLHVQGSAESLQFFTHMGAIAATVPMFAYVVMGLWLDRYLLWIGLAVTALTVAGLFLLQPYFWLWMAVAGGGTLIGTGLFIRRRWR